jgi:hypothetical protein
MFEALNTSKATLVKQVKSLLIEYQPTMKFIVYVKDEGANLNTIVIALTYVFFVHHCKLHHHLLTFSFGILCLRHDKYATNETKMKVGMKEVNPWKSKVLCKIPLHGQRNLGREDTNRN